MYNLVYCVFPLFSAYRLLLYVNYIADDAPCWGAKRTKYIMNFRAIVIALSFAATLFGGRTPNVIQYLRDRYDHPTIKWTNNC